MPDFKFVYEIICPVAVAEALRDKNQLPRISLIPSIFGLAESRYQEADGECYFFVLARRSEAARMAEALPGSTLA